ncbi:helix-turn-helix domain-containing protein [Acutalibacter sp. 1XD8-33]|uniref:helix-turn-helix domain-containing protein n=1 Tax=Acutalibacter sp. 1XD8-33 TaxID=2320081 RepID=UPI000EA00386|nr:helix-turn-helix domain-containing protein [Acutalibacter sp. 1XD8-33]RKJ39999.1 helix-turn-helix domain-containing protein [Acutalibacter sp. 1XD8-33]
MWKYRYLTFADRKQISAWYQSNDRAADVAVRLGMSVKTIYLELKRGEETDESGAVMKVCFRQRNLPGLTIPQFLRTIPGFDAPELLQRLHIHRLRYNASRSFHLERERPATRL